MVAETLRRNNIKTNTQKKKLISCNIPLKKPQSDWIVCYFILCKDINKSTYIQFIVTKLPRASYV